MRYRELLGEKWAMSLPDAVAGMAADIFVNPTRGEFSKLMSREWGDRVCRACISTVGDLYVWHTDHALHDDVQERGGVAMLPVSLFLHYPAKTVWWGELSYFHEGGDLYDSAVKDLYHRIKNCPAISKVYGGDWSLIGEDDSGDYTLEINQSWVDQNVK